MNEGSSRAEIQNHYGKLPLSFEANEGQTDQQVKFLSRGPGYGLFLTSSGLVLTVQEPKPPSIDKFKAPASAGDHSITSGQQVSVLRLKMIGANPKTGVEGRDDVAAECTPQDVQCLAQCRSRVLLVELRPEQGEQAVAAVESSGSGGREVGEQRETARSSEQPLDLVSRGIGQLQSPEHPELDHATLLSVTASGDATVTTW